MTNNNDTDTDNTRSFREAMCAVSFCLGLGDRRRALAAIAEAQKIAEAQGDESWLAEVDADRFSLDELTDELVEEED